MVAAAHFVRILTGFLVAECKRVLFVVVLCIKSGTWFFLFFFVDFFVDFFCAIKFLFLFYFDN